MNTMQNYFNEYLKRVYPDVQLSDIQAQEIKRAFYAGVSNVMILNGKIANLPENDAIATFNKITKELKQFSEDVMEGKA